MKTRTKIAVLIILAVTMGLMMTGISVAALSGKITIAGSTPTRCAVVVVTKP